MINILEHVNPLAFFIAFCVGIFVVYVTIPEPTIIIKYPTPDNTENNVYKDMSDTCYKYKSKEVECSKYKNVIETDLQHIELGGKKKKKSIFQKLASTFKGDN